MKCPVCNHPDSRVLDSRPNSDASSIKRRRECPACGKRFTTYEVVDTVPVTVVKRDGSREFFDKHKLMLGIERACQKRPVDAAQVAASIESELQNPHQNDFRPTPYAADSKEYARIMSKLDGSYAGGNLPYD